MGKRTPRFWRRSRIFGGRAWTLDPISGQYYLHLFLPEQPDLNWRNPAVREEFDAILRFWLERGIDGFRVDAAQTLIKDARLRSNPQVRLWEPTAIRGSGRPESERSARRGTPG